MNSLSSLCLPASQASLNQRARVGEEGCSRGWGETQRQEDGATRELCTKLEQVEARAGGGEETDFAEHLLRARP